MQPRYEFGTGFRGTLGPVVAVLVALLTGIFAQATAQESYPSKPIRLILTNPVGGTVGLLAQTIAEGFRSKFDQPVIVEPKPGANGNLAMEAVIKSEPDGHTLVVGPAGPFTTNHLIFANTSYDPARDLTPIALLASSPLVLVVKPSLPVKSVKELIDYGRANPGKLSYSSQGVGSTGHLAMEYLKGVEKLDMVHITYPGSAQAMTDLLGGRIDLAFDNTATSVPHIRTGALRALAVAEPQRLTSLTDVPTMMESGVPNFVVSPWFGLAGPARMPGAAVERLSKAVREVLEDQALRRRFAESGVELRGNTPAEFAEVIASESRRWAGVVQSAGIPKR
jgi:tripartite-type tricarboxylate transporter receptor subunit TctC